MSRETSHGEQIDRSRAGPREPTAVRCGMVLRLPIDLRVSTSKVPPGLVDDVKSQGWGKAYRKSRDVKKHLFFWFAQSTTSDPQVSTLHCPLFFVGGQPLASVSLVCVRVCVFVSLCVCVCPYVCVSLRECLRLFCLFVGFLHVAWMLASGAGRGTQKQVKGLTGSLRHNLEVVL